MGCCGPRHPRGLYSSRGSRMVSRWPYELADGGGNGDDPALGTLQGHDGKTVEHRYDLVIE